MKFSESSSSFSYSILRNCRWVSLSKLFIIIISIIIIHSGFHWLPNDIAHQENTIDHCVSTAMALAAKLYFDAMSKIGESAAVSPVSRELGKFPCCPFF